MSTSTESLSLPDYVAPGTGYQVAVAYGILVVIGLVSVVITYGIALIVWPITLITLQWNAKKQEALLRGSCVLVDDDQFPEIRERAVAIAGQLSLREVPDVYIMESNQQNAAAAKVGAKHIVILIDDIVHGAYTTGNPAVLDFYLAHELAHHAFGHTGFVRSRLSQASKSLSRLDEFSCDAVAAAVVGNTKTSVQAMSLLLTGPQLLPKMNLKSILDQAKQVAQDKNSRKAEKSLSHPLVLRRLARVLDPTLKP